MEVNGNGDLSSESAIYDVEVDREVILSLPLV